MGMPANLSLRSVMNLEVSNGIRLTEIRRSDQDALIEFLNDRDVNATTVRIPFPYTAADAEDWFTTVGQLTRQNGQPVNWAIRNEADKLIGDIGLELEAGCRSHRAEIGYWLAKPFWGRGIMTAVVKAVCQHAFENLGLARITAHVFSFNDASARVLQKCGFEQEGYMKKHYLKDGKFIDAKAYGLVK
jgi:ribosomal-protein-alanine N-acetyltransferase